MYTYYTKIEKVVDGDTVDVFIDLGFKVWRSERIRLVGVDTAEKNTPYGKATKDYLTQLLAGKIVKLEVFKPDKYGRYLGKIYINSEISINDQMVSNGMAKGYMGDSKVGLWTPEELAVDKIDVVLS
jgi:micrococcal nuclease